jgi:hypothetical protein
MIVDADHRRFLVECTLVCASGLGFGAWCASLQSTAVDDAYIYLHSARVLLDGHDPIFAVPALIGVTGPPYAAFLAGLMRLGLADLLALRVAIAISVAAAVVGLWSVARACRLSPINSLCWTIIVLGSGFTLTHLRSGLETGFALALTMALIIASLHQRLIVTALAAGLLPALRPELAPVAAAVLVASLQRRSWPQRAIALVLAILALGPWILWLHQTTGYWMPNTAAAKASFYSPVDLTWLAHVQMTARGVGDFVLMTLPAAMGLWGLSRERIGRVGFMACLVVAIGAGIFFPIGLLRDFLRYQYTLWLPWCAFGGALVIRRWNSREASVALAAVALVTIGLPARSDDAQSREFIQVGQWIDQMTAENATLLIHDAGAISVFAHRRAVDLVGLKTPWTVAMRSHWSSLTPRARAQALASILRAGHADYLVVMREWDEAFSLATGLQEQSFQIELVRPSPHELGTWGYRIYRVTDLQSSRLNPGGIETPENAR